MGTMLCLVSLHSIAAIVEGEITDQAGQPVANAVVTAMPLQTILPTIDNSTATAVLDQRNREFLPHVLVVRTGTEVSFPNNDAIRHHVYSFSQIKRFDIKLYKDMPPSPIKFDTPGVAVLGCNIHDWMISYVYVTDAPYFTHTDASGHWLLDVPENNYRLSLWHPYLQQNTAINLEPFSVMSQQPGYLTQTLNLKNTQRNGKPPTSLQAEGYKGDP
jgi:plastocyanin